MGTFTKFIARIGATGSTARWVGKHYLRLKKDGMSDKDVFVQMIEFRYQVLRFQENKDELLKRTTYLINLADLTFSILQIEGAIKTAHMPMDLQKEVLAVIMEELKKTGVSNEIITKL